MELFLIFFVIVIPFLGYFIYKNIRRNVNISTKIFEFVIIYLFFVALGLFAFAWAMCSADYYTAIDIVDGGYTPFASKHLLTLIVFFLLSIGSVLLLWLKGNYLPPLILVLSLVFLIIGVVISFAIIVQTSANTKKNYGLEGLFFMLPIMYIAIAGILSYKVIVNEGKFASSKVYNNALLNFLNVQMAKAYVQPIWVVVLLVPVFVVVVAILILFGQDYNSISKVFTETTTWHFSQKTHPPFLDHRGHYLCTIAVCGDPEVVKPLRLGKRHGHEIVVNRQLLIANAFEELIQESTPKFHRLIRGLYDKYGYPLSKKITTAKGSNLTYRLMKPLEYFFLLVLYICVYKPETKINKQYA